MNESRSMRGFAIMGVVLTFWLLALASCRSDPPPVEQPFAPAPGPAVIRDADIDVLDADLEGRLEFFSTVRVRSTGMPMSVEVPVRNRTGRTLLIEYRFTFFGPAPAEADSETEPESGWIPAAIEPDETVRLAATAPNRAATRHRLEIRSAR